MAKPSLTNIILFYNKTIGRKELFYKKCNIWLISLEVMLDNFLFDIEKLFIYWYNIKRRVNLWRKKEKLLLRII